MVQVQTEFLQQRGFVGLDLFHPAHDLDSAHVQQADNLLVVGGEFVTRPGKKAMFSTPLADPIYAPLPFIQTNGVSRIFFVSGGATTGKLYWWDKGNTAPTLVSGSPVDLNAPGAQMARAGGYGYVVDGVNAVRRFNASALSTPVTGQTPPSSPPSAALANSTIDTLTSSTGWAGDTFASNFAYTDLAIGTPSTQVSSVTRPFCQVDVGKTLTITGGTGFTISTPTITSVSTGGVATLSAGAGTSGSTGGAATLPQVGSGITMIPTSQADIDGYPNTPSITSGTLIGTSWIATGLSPSINDYSHSGGSEGLPAAYAGTATKWFQFDDPGGGFHTLDHTNTLQNPVLANPNGDRYCSQYLVSFCYYTSDRRSLQGFKIRVDGYNVTNPTYLSTAPICTAVTDFIPQFAGQEPGQKYSHMFDFTGLHDNVLSVIVSIVGADGNVNSQQFGNGRGNIYASNLVVAPIDNRVMFTAGAVGLTVKHAEDVLGTEQASAYYGAVGGIRLTRDFGASPVTDWSKYNVIDIGLTTATGSTQSVADLIKNGLKLQLGFRQTGSTDHYYSNVMDFSDDTTYASVDISTLPLSVRQSFRYLELIILNDISATKTTSQLATLGPITAAGNLSIGLADYSWPYTEVDASADLTNLVNIVESDPSAPSNALAPTTFKAQADITFAPPLNAATTHYYVYRYGGVFADATQYPVAKLIAKLPIGSDTIEATSPGAGYLTWNHTTRTLRDNTPDLSLFYTDSLITGRGTPPVGAQAVAQWQNRLWLAKGSTLYGSWLLTESNSAGLYFNSISTPDDPNLAIKGLQVSVGGADNDTIKALISLGAMLIILKSRSVWMLTGNSGDNFQLSGHLIQAGVGCVAPRAWALVENAPWFLAGDGVWEYDGGDTIQPKSLEIEPLLAPAVYGQTPIPAQYFTQAAMLYAGRRLYLFAPGTASDTANTVAYVLDMRQGGWTRFTGMNISSACTTSSAGDNAEIYLAGLDGQIYQLTGSGDTATRDATPAAVPFSFTSRGFGQEENGLKWWQESLPTYLYAAVNTNEATSVTLGATAAGCAATFSATYHATGRTSARVPIANNVRGDHVSISVGGSTVTQTKITSVATEIAQGGLP